MGFVMSHEALGFPGISGNGFQSHITTEGEKKWRRTAGVTLLKGTVQEVLMTIAALPLYTAHMKLSSVCTGGQFASRRTLYKYTHRECRVYCDIQYITYCIPID